MEHNLTFHRFPYCNILYISEWTFQYQIVSWKLPCCVPILQWRLFVRFCNHLNHLVSVTWHSRDWKVMLSNYFQCCKQQISIFQTSPVPLPYVSATYASAPAKCPCPHKHFNNISITSSNQDYSRLPYHLGGLWESWLLRLNMASAKNRLQVSMKKLLWTSYKWIYDCPFLWLFCSSLF